MYCIQKQTSSCGDIPIFLILQQATVVSRSADHNLNCPFTLNGCHGLCVQQILSNAISIYIIGRDLQPKISVGVLPGS